MKKLTLLLAALFTATSLLHAQDSLTIRKIYDEALVNGKAYETCATCAKILAPG